MGKKKELNANNTSSSTNDNNKILNRFVEAVATIMYNINIIIQWYVMYSVQSVHVCMRFALL